MKLNILKFTICLTIAMLLVFLMASDSYAYSAVKIYAHKNSSYIAVSENSLYVLGQQQNRESSVSEFTALDSFVLGYPDVVFGDDFIAFPDENNNSIIFGSNKYVKNTRLNVTNDSWILAAGTDHMLLLNIKFELYTLGRNQKGQLGDGTTNAKKNPKKILDQIMNVSAGGNSSFAIDMTGNLFGWGDNSHGQLGTGNKTQVKKPELVMHDVEDVWTNGFSTFIRKKSGHIYACGSNKHGKLGVRSNSTTVLKPELVGLYEDVSLGKNHTLLLDKNGTLYGCGSNKYQQLGLSQKSNYQEPTKLKEDIIQMACGDYHSLYIDGNGQMYGCGYNKYSQVGMNEKEEGWRKINMPKDIETSFKTYLESISQATDREVIEKIDNYIKTNGYPAKYAGEYLQNGKLIIKIVDMDIDTISIFKEVSNTDNIGYEYATYSYSELLAEQEKIEKYIENNQPNSVSKNIVAISVLQEKNAVGITLMNDSSIKIQEFKKEVSDSPMLYFSQGNAEKPD